MMTPSLPCVERFKSLLFTAAIIVSSFQIGCEFDPLADGASGPADCSACHATSQYSDMPFSVDGGLSLGEGSHLSHLEAPLYGNPVLCGECHVIPAGVEHVDPLPAEVVFGTFASTGGTKPVWNREEGTCSGVYCHGATLSGGSNTSPTWTITDGSQVACGSCHGFPPEDGHPTSTSCGDCHGAVYSDGEWVDSTLHIDGEVQTGAP